MHPDAEQVYERVAAKKPNISKATVYRNLNLLAEEGEIGRVRTAAGAGPFRPRRIQALPFPLPRVREGVRRPLLSAALPLPAHEGEFLVESCNVEFVGLCPACDKK